jgi:hypothetical protein
MTGSERVHPVWLPERFRPAESDLHKGARSAARVRILAPSPGSTSGSSSPSAGEPNRGTSNARSKTSSSRADERYGVTSRRRGACRRRASGALGGGGRRGSQQDPCGSGASSRRMGAASACHDHASASGTRPPNAIRSSREKGNRRDPAGRSGPPLATAGCGPSGRS